MMYLFFFSFIFYIDSPYYYGTENLTVQEPSNNNESSTTALNQDLRSPLAATRANSVSASSPTGSACTKSNRNHNNNNENDIFLV